ncbi:hypothetical protein [Brevundimonas sp. TWP2-3-4b1]|uniref:hypothetical protein n=1 Tax=Brevundimonas sp. TWP2-3-4b1 TaxID=2804580 RepID=UPI003CED5FF2
MKRRPDATDQGRAGQMRIAVEAWRTRALIWPLPFRGCRLAPEQTIRRLFTLSQATTEIDIPEHR